MNYLLTSVNKTQSRAIAVRDYIKMAFKINPNDIRYDDNIPSLNTNLSEVSKNERTITLRERINGFIANIQGSLGKITLNSINELSNDRYEVELTVGEENLKFKL